MLDTGNPLPDPDRNGPAIAVVVNGQPYLVDAGEGVWRGMGREGPDYDGRFPAFKRQSNTLAQIFLTHLHNDHTLGLPAAILGPWTLGKTKPPHVYGPPGTEELVEHILIAYRRDIDFRIYSPTRKNDTGWRAVAHEITEPGLIYEDANVKVRAFKSCHATWPLTFAYRFETPDRVIAVSGDTRPCPGVVAAAKGADILLHEVYALGSLDQAPWPNTAEEIKRLKKLWHTSTEELAEIANEVQPKLLVLYHEQNWSGDPEQTVTELERFGYKGKVISSRDRDIF